MNIYEQLSGPYEFSIDITNKCNLRCLHCYNYSGENNCIEQEMSDEMIIDLVHKIAAMKPINVCLSGGEPLMRKELVYKITEILTSYGIFTSMVSNGLLINKETGHLLKRAGLKRIQISLDGTNQSHDKLRNKKGAFEKVINCLAILKKLELTTYIGYVPTNFNIGDFESILEIALENNVVSLRTQYLMPSGRGKDNSFDITPSESDYRILVNKIMSARNRIAAENLSLNIEWDDPVEHFYDICEVQTMYPQIHIKANGNLTVTPYLPVSFGNVNSMDFEKLCTECLVNSNTNNLFLDMCSRIYCVSDLSLEGLGLPINFKDEDIVIDRDSKPVL